VAYALALLQRLSPMRIEERVGITPSLCLLNAIEINFVPVRMQRKSDGIEYRRTNAQKYVIGGYECEKLVCTSCSLP